jgi:hypothetical protein
VILTQGTPPVSQDPQHRKLLVIDHRAQPGHPGRGQRHRVRVGGIGLAALPGGEHPHPRRQLGGHIDDLLTIGEQPAGQVPADPLASFHPPDPLRPRPHPREHRRIPGSVSGEPPTAEDGLIPSHDLDGGGTLVRIHPDDYPAHPVLPAWSCHERRGERGGHRYFEQNKPLLSLSRCHGST